MLTMTIKENRESRQVHVPLAIRWWHPHLYKWRRPSRHLPDHMPTSRCRHPWTGQAKENDWKRNLNQQQRSYIEKSGYIHTKLQEFHLIDASDRTNPSFANLPTIAQSKAISEYQQPTGSFQYAASATRPDISFQGGTLSRFNNSPDYPYLKAVKKILKYLKGTADYGIYFAKGSGRQFRLECHDPTDRQSTTGYVINIASGPIAWGSKGQTVCAQLSAEAVLIALSTVLK